MKKLIPSLVAVIIAVIYMVTIYSFFGCSKQMKGGQQEKGKSAKETILTVGDLSLTISGTTFTTTISPNAEWGGVQKFVTMSTNDGATSECNWNWSGVQAPTSQTCSSSGTGFYRSWTSDKVTRDIHLSNVIQIQ
jgi:hypothetical protein